SDNRLVGWSFVRAVAPMPPSAADQDHFKGCGLAPGRYIQLSAAERRSSRWVVRTDAEEAREQV
ncbi:MAG: hypothetical protein QGG36_14770, partial [Pirellulaceae bacterium]|nr:hypothetical protein [Pirellulaceae bacterium]